MIKILLDAVKIALSKDARQSASGLIEFIRRSPNWQKDICTLEATIGSDSQEYTYLLGGLTKEKMKALGYGNESVSAYEFVYRELTSNAFEHGCPKNKPRVTIIIEITSHFVSVTIRNPRGAIFNLNSLIEAQKEKLARNPNLSRGRGLVACREYADVLQMTPKNDGVKAVFYNPPVKLKTERIENLAVVRLIEGMENPSMPRRLEAEARKMQDCNLVIDFSNLVDLKKSFHQAMTEIGRSTLLEKMHDTKMYDTQAMRQIVVLGQEFESRGKKLFLFHPSRNPQSVMHNHPIVVTSIKDIADKMGIPTLVEKLQKLIHHRDDNKDAS